MIWRTLILIVLMLGAMAAAKARADDCPHNPNALRTSRVLTVDPREFPRVGTVQYSHSLPLEEKEVVLTFDDGPLPPYTHRVLDVLAEHCVKANYFLVGRMARGYPDIARRILSEGHTIGTHSENHLLGFDRMPIDTVRREIEQGIASVTTVLGKGTAANAFFRIPGLLRHQEVEAFLQARRLMTWSADVVADDWKNVSASEVVRRAIARLDEKGKGILLLHDIQPATALALPELLRQLKAKGFRIVHVVPGKGEISVPVAARPSPPATEAATVQVIAKPPQVTTPHVVAPALPPAPAAVTVAVATPEAAVPQHPPRAELEKLVAPVQPPTMPASAAESLARGDDIPRDPVRPFTSGSKPPRNMPTPGKLVTSEPGGWPPVVGVPVPAAGGVGVSSVTRQDQMTDGRFQ